MGALAVELVVSCEHGGNRIPPPYRHLFQDPAQRLSLESHRGFDAGALIMARELGNRLGAPVVTATVSRLLVDLNRSLGHRALHAPAVRAAPVELRRQIVERHYQPYRRRVESLIRQGLESGGRVLHVSCHSFTPELDGDVRNADIGLLYHPQRSGEVDLCQRWQATLKSSAPRLKVRRNYPYQGKNDGLTQYLRGRFSAAEYLGIELEINQKHVLKRDGHWPVLRDSLIDSLRQTLACEKT